MSLSFFSYSLALFFQNQGTCPNATLFLGKFTSTITPSMSSSQKNLSHLNFNFALSVTWGYWFHINRIKNFINIYYFTFIFIIYVFSIPHWCNYITVVVNINHLENYQENIQLCLCQVNVRYVWGTMVFLLRNPRQTFRFLYFITSTHGSER